MLENVCDREAQKVQERQVSLDSVALKLNGRVWSNHGPKTMEVEVDQQVLHGHAYITSTSGGSHSVINFRQSTDDGHIHDTHNFQFKILNFIVSSAIILKNLFTIRFNQILTKLS